MLARHCTEAALSEKAAHLWGKAGQRSLERSALIEAAQQLTRALAEIATLPSTLALRREQIKLQIALANALMHSKGYAAPETKSALREARLLIERAEVLGEPPEDPLVLFSVLYGFWAANYVAFNGDILRELATQFLALAKKQGATGPIMIGHRLMATSLLLTGDIVKADALDRGDGALRSHAASFAGNSIWSRRRGRYLMLRALALWSVVILTPRWPMLSKRFKEARKIGQAVTLAYAMSTSISFIVAVAITRWQTQ